MDAFINNHWDYVFAWSSYVGAGLIALVMVWVMTRKIKWTFIKELALLIVAVLLFIPLKLTHMGSAVIPEGFDWYSPANIAAMMSLLNGDIEGATDIATKIGIILGGAIAAYIVLKLAVAIKTRSA